jgi:peptidoglycan hydrolase-like protein with peptidoglycan-binding domain
VAGAAAVVIGGCGSSGHGSGITTLPTLPASSIATTTTPAPTIVTLPTTAPALTAPHGTAPTVTTTPTTAPVSTTPPAATTTTFPTGGVSRYVDEPPSGPLQIGFRGPRVQVLQGQLQQLGYRLDADGYYGRGTEAAVRAFQQAQGMSADGVATVDTQARLSQATGH